MKSHVVSSAPAPLYMLVRAFEGGGAQRDAIELANGLFRAGWPIAIVTLDSSGPFAVLVDPALPIIDLGRGRKLRMALSAPALAGLIRRERPAAIISSEASANVLITLVARLLPKSNAPPPDPARGRQPPCRRARPIPSRRTAWPMPWRPASTRWPIAC